MLPDAPGDATTFLISPGFPIQQKCQTRSPCWHCCMRDSSVRFGPPAVIVATVRGQVYCNYRKQKKGPKPCCLDGIVRLMPPLGAVESSLLDNWRVGPNKTPASNSSSLLLHPKLYASEISGTKTLSSLTCNNSW
eukprot:TRINITY_DN17046_c0_g1_i1.p1 TRINITY_DN17046_c0_g1~~TRINITY_DN17046_c0_g1_i1.p1  ORF type:complete len:135 (+),score=20.05 TRINITY_DN17046_c0_g1_i1:180-584(+)